MTTFGTERTTQADARIGDLRPLVVARIAPLLSAAGIDPAQVTCSFAGDASSASVILDLPRSVSRGLEHALGERVLDAVHASGPTFGRVNVVVDSSGETREPG
jgi:hypothetical protein